MVVDLTTSHGQELVWRVIKEGRVVFVHMGPPCGTASRARERRIPKWQRRAGAPEPQPLRSTRFPRGLPFLGSVDAEKVRKANCIYDFCADVAHHCMQHDIGFSIENPMNSYLWMLQAYAELQLTKGVHKVSFSACMWGARRDKKTSLLTNVPTLLDMAKDCDGSHDHLPWGVHWKDGWTFATAEECEYPAVMCRAIASRVAKHAGLEGPSEPPRQRKPKSKPSTWDLHQRAALGRQPRGKRIPPLVPEYCEAPEPWSVTDPDDIATIASQPSRLDKDVTVGGRTLPKGTNLINRRTSKDMGANGCAKHRMDFELGKPWSAQEFVSQAMNSEHPISRPPQVPDDLLLVVGQVASLGVQGWKTLMAERLKFWQLLSNVNNI